MPGLRSAAAGGAVVSVLTDMTTDALREAWRGLRNGANATDVAFVRGMVEMGFVVGALSNEQVELWLRRIKECPGHNDEGWRDWCAYCGDMPAEEGAG